MAFAGELAETLKAKIVRANSSGQTRTWHDFDGENQRTGPSWEKFLSEPPCFAFNE